LTTIAARPASGPANSWFERTGPSVFAAGALGVKSQ
jgi:hypothetical protein